MPKVKKNRKSAIDEPAAVNDKSNIDEPTVVDELGIGRYVKGLSSFISECDTPMTIAIQGDWGSGKTSMMKMVINDLDKKKVKTVEFNAWQFSQFATDDLLAKALITTITKQIGAADSKTGKELENDLYKMGGAGGLKAFGNIAANFAGDRTVGSTNMLEFKETLAIVKASIETIAKLKKKFKGAVEEAVANQSAERVLIFIDDLDRLQPIRAVELLEVLKIFLDCEKCVFALAIDYNVVVSGLMSKYGKDITANKGRSFFDKIIQVPFKMPIPQYNIKDFVKKQFETISKEECSDEDKDNYEQLISYSIGRNPRSIKRLFNSYELLLKIVDEEVLKNCGREGKKALFAILCMQLHFEELYNFIVLNSDDDEIINNNFFNRLAEDVDSCSNTLYEHDIVELNEESDSDEVIKINGFIKRFNETLTGFEMVSDDEFVNKLKPFLKDSTVTGSESKASTNKKAIFFYNNVRYEQGAIGNNLGKLALNLIKDYSIENANMPAEDIRKFINEEISCYHDSEISKAGLGQVNYKSDVEEKNVLKIHFTGVDSEIQLGDDVLLVSKGWGINQLVKLISLLQYRNKIKSNKRLPD